MKENDIHILLLEYAEGTLSSEQRERVEEALRSSKDLRSEYESIKLALSSVGSLDDPHIPTHYFSSLLPSIREKMDEQRHKRFFIPLWIEKLVMPAGTVAVIAILVLCYFAFQPTQQNEIMYQTVRNAQEEDISTLAAMATPEGPLRESKTIEHLIDILSSASFDSYVSNQYFADAQVSSVDSRVYDSDDIESTFQDMNTADAQQFIDTIEPVHK